MASDYTGNPFANEPPSPSPSPGSIPIVSIPAGTDVRTIESITQGTKALTDYSAYTQRSVQLAPPSFSADGSGYSAVTHTGTGTGTCAPTALSSTVPHSSTQPYPYLIKIIVGGAVGTATFQMSINGGTTFGSTVTTSATVIVAPTGISLSFVGTFVAGDTYAFVEVDRPLLSLVGSSIGGVGAQEFDHLGFPQGKYQLFREDWCGSGFTVGPSQSAVATWNRWIATTSANAGINAGAPNSSYPGASVALDTAGATPNAAVIYTNAMMYAGYASLYSAMEFDFGISDITSAGSDIYMGWSSTPTPEANSSDRALIYWKASTQKLTLQTANGSISLLSSACNIQPTASNFPNMRARIEVYGSSSVYGNMVRLFLDNGTGWNLCNVEIGVFPTTGLYPMFRVYNAGSGTGTYLARIGSVRATWNVWT